MLKLANMTIKNFRSIREETFVLPSLAVLIGKNDAGKSNVLEAIDILLEGSKDSVTVSDFYDEEGLIEIEACFEGAGEYLELVDDQNRTKIKDRLDGGGALRLRRTARAATGLGKIEVWDPKKREFGTPTGIDAAIKAMLPEPIYIESLADVGDELKGTQKDALGKLVGQIVSVVETKIEPSLKAAYAEANRDLNVQRNEKDGTEKDERVPELQGIEKEITEYLKETFPGLSIRLQVRLPSVKQILGSVDVMVREGSHVDPYYRRGQGLQRSLYLSLLRALAARARTEADKVKKPFILLFEEAEAFLHPEGQTKMRAALGAISKRAQVVFTTHSPLMIDPSAIGQVLRIEKRLAGAAKGVTKRFGPVKVGGVTEKEIAAIFALQRSSKFLFARGVLLVEGEGDEHIFDGICSAIGKPLLEDLEVVVVEVGGKDQIRFFREVLGALGLRVWALTDLDFLWAGAGKVLGADAELSALCEALDRRGEEEFAKRHACQTMTDEAEKRARKEIKKELCRAELAKERDAVCGKLREARIFVLRQGELEEYVGLGHRGKGDYMRVAGQLRSGERGVLHKDEFEELWSQVEKDMGGTG